MSTIYTKEHENCVFCSKRHYLNLDLHICRICYGYVVGQATPSVIHQSYQGELHGGITSLILDGVMTNCLFAEGITAVTARLNIRYLHPVEVDSIVNLVAQLVKSKGNVHFLKASLSQNGEVKAKATATFMNRMTTDSNL